MNVHYELMQRKSNSYTSQGLTLNYLNIHSMYDTGHSRSSTLYIESLRKVQDHFHMNRAVTSLFQPEKNALANQLKVETFKTKNK